MYTWVDDEDPNWQEKYSKARAILSEDASKTNNEDTIEDKTALSRFKNRQELKYSLRSVEHYLPWVRKIYIFSNCEKPDWLQEVDNLIWVDHQDVIPTKYLPTFNSHAIESYLHKIPSLSEHFIYLNDDFFINKELPRTAFFSSNGVCKANLEDYGMVSGKVDVTDADYLNAARNGVKLIQRDFGMSPTQLHKHSPYAMRKSIMQKMEKDYSAEFERTRENIFRSHTDISTASFLFHYYGYAINAVTFSGFRSKLIKNTAKNITADFKMLEKIPTIVKTFCLNDGKESHVDDSWNTAIVNFLERRFSLASSAEKDVLEITNDTDKKATNQE